MENQRSWEQRHPHEDDAIQSDQRIDPWVRDALRGIGYIVAGAVDRLDRIEATQRTISRHLAAIRNSEGDEMATLEDVQSLVTQTGVDAQETADRVLAAIAAVTTGAADQIAALQQQVADLIAGNAADITPEQLQAVADGLTSVDTTIKGIAAAPVVEPPAV